MQIEWLRTGSYYNEPSQSNHEYLQSVLPGSGGGYNNAIINNGGHFTRCHISVNIKFTNLCSRNQFQHLLKYEYYILLEIQMMNFKRMLNLETMLNLPTSIT